MEEMIVAIGSICIIVGFWVIMIWLDGVMR